MRIQLYNSRKEPERRKVPTPSLPHYRIFRFTPWATTFFHFTLKHRVKKSSEIHKWVKPARFISAISCAEGSALPWGWRCHTPIGLPPPGQLIDRRTLNGLEPLAWLPQKISCPDWQRVRASSTLISLFYLLFLATKATAYWSSTDRIRDRSFASSQSFLRVASFNVALFYFLNTPIEPLCLRRWAYWQLIAFGKASPTRAYLGRYFSQ